MEELEYKVIGFDGDRVILGDRGGFAKAYPLSCFNFNPKIGDIVEKYEGADYVLLSRKCERRVQFVFLQQGHTLRNHRRLAESRIPI